jgi:16S rRNA (guanine(966)-N(2))-methyltransferase RsmD
MRIIAGALGGRTLATPKDERTRPMLEKTRGAVFNILGSAVEGARVLDLYSGTGALGLEALSRGAARARFVERDRVARAALARNVAELGVAERAEVVGGDVAAEVARCGAGEFDLVFLDPPYRLAEEPRTRAELLRLAADLCDRVIAAGGSLVLHVPAGSLGERDFGGRVPRVFREYGRNAIAIFDAGDRAR